MSPCSTESSLHHTGCAVNSSTRTPGDQVSSCKGSHGTLEDRLQCGHVLHVERWWVMYPHAMFASTQCTFSAALQLERKALGSRRSAKAVKTVTEQGVLYTDQQYF